MPKLAHISDLHFGKVDRRIADALHDDLHDFSPALLVVSGDLTQRAKPSQFQAAADYLKTLPSPQLVVPGNHDVPAVNWFARFLTPLENYKRYITSDLRPVYQDDELLVMGISTARSFTRQGGIIRPEQLIDLALRARQTPERLFKVVVTHHPLMPAPGELRTDLVSGHRQALQTFEQVGVDLLMSGHFHLAYSGDIRTHHTAVKRSILSVHAGTATSTRIRHREPQGYNRLTVRLDHVTIQPRIWDGGRFVDGVPTHYTRIDGEWWRDEAIGR